MPGANGSRRPAASSVTQKHAEIISLVEPEETWVPDSINLTLLFIELSCLQRYPRPAKLEKKRDE